jgi:Eukaryotic aspartyl protease
MKLLALLASTAVLIPSSLAFYPYHQPNDVALKKASFHSLSRRKETQDESLSLPLVRRPVERSNGFNIISASKPAAQNSLGIDQDGTDFSYFCAFQFGTSSKTFYLLLDSAAANTWVMGADCTTNACGTHNTLGASDSSSLKV